MQYGTFVECLVELCQVYSAGRNVTRAYFRDYVVEYTDEVRRNILGTFDVIMIPMRQVIRMRGGAVGAQPYPGLAAVPGFRFLPRQIVRKPVEE